MEHSEDWRRRRAEALKLIDASPLAVRAPHIGYPFVPGQPAMTRPGAGDDAVCAASVETRRSDAVLPAGIAETGGAGARRHPAIFAGIAFILGLTLAGILGWWLRGTMMPAPVEVAAPASVAPPRTQPPALPEPPHVAAPAPAPASVASAVPAAVKKAADRPVAKKAVTSQAKSRALPQATKKSQPAGRAAPRSAAPPGRYYRASFDCRTAVSRVTTMICGSRALSTLDMQMASAYRAAVAAANLDRERRLDAEQTVFLNERARCTNEACLNRRYSKRIKQLERGR